MYLSLVELDYGLFKLHSLYYIHVFPEVFNSVGDNFFCDGGDFLACEDFGRRFGESFPVCSF